MLSVLVICLCIIPRPSVVLATVEVVTMYQVRPSPSPKNYDCDLHNQAIANKRTRIPYSTAPVDCNLVIRAGAREKVPDSFLNAHLRNTNKPIRH